MDHAITQVFKLMRYGKKSHIERRYKTGTIEASGLVNAKAGKYEGENTCICEARRGKIMIKKPV